MLFGKYINRYYLRYLPALLVGVLALVAVDYMQLLVPELYGLLINGLSGGTVTVDGETLPFDMTFLLDRICLPMILVILCMVVGRFLWRICFRVSAIRMETHLRGEMFSRAKDLSQQYYEVNKVGSMMTLFTNDLETVQDCFGWGVLMFCDALFLGVLAIGKMLMMDPLLTLFSMVPMAFMLVIGAVMHHRLEKGWDARQEAFAKLSDYAQETFSGIAVIKAFVKELKRQMGFSRINRENEQTNVAYTKTSTLLHILVTLFVESVICVIFGYGGYLVHSGSFDAGQLVTFIGYFTSLIWPVMAVSQLIEMKSRGKASLSRIAALLDAEADVRDREGAVEATDLRGGIEFRSLTFRHPGASYDALTDVSFQILPGEHVGIIGRTGAGKSTLVDLLLRIYNVPDGTVFFDGHDVNSLTIASVRRSCAYVPQDNFLFSDTISSNIAFSKDGATEEEIRASAVLADVHGNITEFTDGYATVLGERGVTVSGGQKQRISIARALLREAGVLILDDAVSAVDVSTEKTILENLRRTRAGKTTLLIAHRVSTVESMDKIVFLDDGRVLDVGTHEELYGRCEAYRRTVELQKLSEAEHTQAKEVASHA